MNNIDRKKIILNDLIFLIILIFSVLTFLSLISFNINDSMFFNTNPVKPINNFIGTGGAYWSSILLFGFGRAAYFLCIIIFLSGLYKITNKNKAGLIFIITGFSVLMITFSILFSIHINEKSNLILINNGGIIGLFLKTVLIEYLGTAGVYIITTCLIILSLMLLLNFSLNNIVVFFNNIKTYFGIIFNKVKELIKTEEIPVNNVNKSEKKPPLIKKIIFNHKTENQDSNLLQNEEKKLILFKLPQKKEEKRILPLNNIKSKTKEEITNINKSDKFEFPSIELLDLSTDENDDIIKKDVYETSKKLEETLKEFDIIAKVINISIGPVITRYELQPSAGVKVNKIVSLADNIALSLAAQRVRIVAPIPGKAVVGVEIPNHKRNIVTLGDILKLNNFRKEYKLIEIPLGKDISGHLVKINIKDCPHILIAGATGSGKSVLLNIIICSLIYNCKPDQIRFIMMDPKMVELKIYNGIPHLLTEVITNPKHSITILKYLIKEMERRYELLDAVGARDIDKYNERIKKGKFNDFQALKYIVVIIDEFADLMMMVAREIEELIVRIAQKARAVGIHLIIATQRPSVDVITGLIKANFPTRIAFQVASKIDSRTILDSNGAEKLLGKGDMLVSLGNQPGLIRVQGAYISEEEVENIINYINNYNLLLDYLDINDLIIEIENRDEIELTQEDYDDMYLKAKDVIKETKKASASFLQRRLKIGFNRAARYIDMMQKEGLIGEAIGSKPREVFLDRF